MHTIIAATDFSPSGDAALNTAITLARGFESTILLLHVVEEPTYSWIVDGPGVPEIEQRMNEIGLDARASGVPSVEVIIDKGVASAVVSRTARLRAADLIVLGCGSAVDDSESRIGLTAERVLRRSDTPVWIARPGETAQPRMLVCPVDTSATSRHALEAAITVSARFDAKLIVLDIMEPPPALYGPLSKLQDRAKPSLAERKDEYETRISSFLSGIDFDGVTWTKRSREGKPYEEIIAEVDQIGADLVVMGSGDKVGRERYLLGTVAQTVARRLPCRMLVIKTAARARASIKAEISTLKRHLNRGKDMLSQRNPAEALKAFDSCLDMNGTFVPAWEGKAAAYEQLNDEEAAGRCRNMAAEIRKELDDEFFRYPGS